MILDALAAGAAGGATVLAKDAVVQTGKGMGRSLVDAKDRLVRLVRSRFLGDEDATDDLKVYLRRPTEDNRAAVTGHLIHHGLERDSEVLEAARLVVQIAGPSAVGPSSTAIGHMEQHADHGSAAVGTSSGTINIGTVPTAEALPDPNSPGPISS